MPQITLASSDYFKNKAPNFFLEATSRVWQFVRKSRG